jgi:hypothetical protein
LIYEFGIYERVRVPISGLLTLDLPLVSADEDIQEAIGERAIW